MSWCELGPVDKCSMVHGCGPFACVLPATRGPTSCIASYVTLVLPVVRVMLVTFWLLLPCCVD